MFYKSGLFFVFGFFEPHIAIATCSLQMLLVTIYWPPVNGNG
jgi:hypothetical protein